jgi:hypothetical protein
MGQHNNLQIKSAIILILILLVGWLSFNSYRRNQEYGLRKTECQQLCMLRGYYGGSYYDFHWLVFLPPQCDCKGPRATPSY